MARESKAIICLNNLKIYASAREVCETHDINYGSLYQVCKGHRNSSGKDMVTDEPLQWAYLEDYEKGLRKFNPNAFKERKVICLNTGEVFHSIVSAIVKYGLGDTTGIIAVCKGKTRSYGKHPDTNESLQWAYLEDYEKGLRKFDQYATKSRKVICLTTGEVFESLKEASLNYNVDRSNISHSCSGKAKSAGKHPITGERLRWQYHEEYIKGK